MCMMISDYIQLAEHDGLKLSFQLCISESRRQTTYITFCFPFSYTKCQRMLAKLEAKYSLEVEEKVGDGKAKSANDNIYFHRYQLKGTFSRYYKIKRVILITYTVVV